MDGKERARERIVRLKNKLRQGNLSDDKVRDTNGQIGKAYESFGAHWRGRRFLRRADDYVGVARSYEAQGGPYSSAGDNYVEAATKINRGDTDEERRRTAPQRWRIFKSALNAYDKARENGSSVAVFDREMTAFHGRKQALLDRMSPKRRKKYLEKLAESAKDSGTHSSSSSGGDGMGIALYATTGNPAFLGLDVILVSLFAILALLFLSSRFTGYSVLGVSMSGSRGVGFLFLFLALVVFFLTIVRRKRKHKR